MRFLGALLVFYAGFAWSHTPERAVGLVGILSKLTEPNAHNLVCQSPEPLLPSGVAPAHYCDDFYGFVCSAAPSDDDRKNELTEERIKSFTTSLADGSPDDPVAQSFRQDYLFADLPGWMEENIEQWESAVRSEELRHQRAVGVSDEDLAQAFREVQARMVRMLSESAFPPERRREFVERIQGVSYMNSQQFSRHLQQHALRLGAEYGLTDIQDLPEEDLAVIGPAFYMIQCGLGGSTQNVFTIRREGVHTCPGMLDHMKNYLGLDRNGILSAMRLIFAHELGHSLEVDALMDPVIACLGATNLGIPNIDALSAEDRATLISNQRKEIFSDLWAHEHMREQLRSSGQRGEAAARSLAQSSSFLCEAGEEENPALSHPSGRFRLTMFGRDPEIRRQLGCAANTPERPACTMNGRDPALP